MEELLNQITKALENNLYLVALQSTLTLPSICSALISETGESKGKDYIAWYNENIIDKQNLTGNDCYGFRCGMIHEGKMQHEKIELSRIIFLDPNSNFIFKGNIFSINGEKALNIDLLSFCNEMIRCVRFWWNKNKDNDIVKKNYEKMVRYHKNGLPPFIVGEPVIG